jgi:predicted PurR-regulated permease PerM
MDSFKNRQKIEQIAGIAFVSVIVLGCFVVLSSFGSSVLWAGVLCYATWPLYVRIERICRGHKSLAAGLMTAIITLVLVLPFVFVGLTFADNLASVAHRVAGYSDSGWPSAPAWLARIPLLGERLQDYWGGLVQNSDQVATLVSSWIEKARPWLLRKSLALGRGIFELVLSVLIAFFFYRDGPTVVARLAEGVKRITGDYSQRLIETVGSTVKSVVYGLLGTALAQGILAGIGFLIAGIPGAMLWAMVTFFIAVVPAGPPMIWIPATLWLLVRDRPGAAIFLFAWGLVAISGIDNIVRPVLISRGAQLPFAMILLGVLGGLTAFGFIGIFLGPVVLAAGYSLLKEFLRQRVGEVGPPEP